MEGNCTSIMRKPTVWRSEGVWQGCCISSILFYHYGEYLIKDSLADVRDFNNEHWIINKAKFTDVKAITAKSQEEL